MKDGLVIHKRKTSLFFTDRLFNHLQLEERELLPLSLLKILEENVIEESIYFIAFPNNYLKGRPLFRARKGTDLRFKSRTVKNKSLIESIEKIFKDYLVDSNIFKLDVVSNNDILYSSILDNLSEKDIDKNLVISIYKLKTI